MVEYGDPGTDIYFLKRLAEVSKADEFWRVTTFKGERRRPDGQNVQFTVEVGDRGVGNPLRWTVTARDEAGHEAHGNPGSDLAATMHGVHWQDLDGDDIYPLPEDPPPEKAKSRVINLNDLP
jgi:hypothetical protein